MKLSADPCKKSPKLKRVKVKICGITRLRDARSALVHGADAIGFVFYRKSSRYISVSKASAIVSKLSDPILKVGVFVNPTKQYVLNALKKVPLDIVQLHGDETCDFIKSLGNVKVIKAFRVKNTIDKRVLESYNVFGCLFDSMVQGRWGGTGSVFCWEALKNIKHKKTVWFLSGGLNAQNVHAAICIVKPDWVDVSSSVELSPGIKDAAKIKQFIDAVRGGKNEKMPLLCRRD